MKCGFDYIVFMTQFSLYIKINVKELNNVT